MVCYNKGFARPQAVNLESKNLRLEFPGFKIIRIVFLVINNVQPRKNKVDAFAAQKQIK